MKPLLIIFALLLATSCTLQTQRRGYIFTDGFEEEIAGVKTTAELERIMGSPVARTIFGEMIWIYYGVDENYRGPLPETYSNKTVVLVWPDEAGRIARKEILRDDDLPDFWLARGETPIPAAIKLNALQELFNNVGRFTPAGLGQ